MERQCSQRRLLSNRASEATSARVANGRSAICHAMNVYAEEKINHE